MTDQLGTQLDPPAHWNELGSTISDIPATVALRPLVVIDIHDKVAQEADYTATVGDVQAWEAEFGEVPAGSVVMFRSDWSKTHWHGSESSEAIGAAPLSNATAFPGVSLDALKYLHSNRSILFHGHEPLDTDSTPSLEGEAWLMHHDYAQAEGVTNLDLVSPNECLVSIGFAKALGGTGGYARYIAICPAAWPHGISVADEPGAPLPSQPHPLRRGEDGVFRPTEFAPPTRYCQAPGASPLGCPLPTGRFPDMGGE